MGEERIHSTELERIGRAASAKAAAKRVQGKHPALTAPYGAQSALAVQEGGNHYKDCAIQPVEYIHANHLGFCEGSVIKYITRWRKKNGIADLKKARHFIDLLIELEERKEQQ